MAVLDFKEIPEAHKATGNQDTFELFARDFLSFVGYKILADPNRGADGGVDLIVEEKRTGVGGETNVKWLVSCKHKSYSGNSVSPTDDANIRDRVDSHKCQGFIGFYSTLASAGLSSTLDGLRDRIEIQIFDKEKIEGMLLHSARGLELAERYFPKSLAEWRTENPQPAKLFADSPNLECIICGKELLEQDDKGIVTFWEIFNEDYAEHVFWSCRGHCDQVLRITIREKNSKLIDRWEDIADVMMPTIFIKWVMSIMNNQQSGSKYSDEAFDNLKKFLMQIFPYISRNLTTKEKERVRLLMTLPTYFGGLG